MEDSKIFTIVTTLGVVATIFITLFFGFSVKVPVGYAGIKVNLYGDEKGVTIRPLTTGRNFFNNLTHDVYIYPIFTKQLTYNVKLQDKDGMVITADIGLELKVDKDKVGYVFEKYRSDYSTIAYTYITKWLTNSINLVASSMSVEDMYGEKKQVLRTQALAAIKEVGEKNGIIVEDLYFIGQMELPQAITQRINAKIESTQIAIQKENELRAREAEAKQLIIGKEADAKAILIEAEAKSQANRLMQQSITAELIELKKIEKWNGQLPTTITNGQPMLQVK